MFFRGLSPLDTTKTVDIKQNRVQKPIRQTYGNHIIIRYMVLYACLFLCNATAKMHTSAQCAHFRAKQF